MTPTGRETEQERNTTTMNQQDTTIKANLNASFSSDRAGHKRITLTLDCPNEEASDFITGYLDSTLNTLKIGVLPTNWKLQVQKDRTTADVAERVAAAA